MIIHDRRACFIRGVKIAIAILNRQWVRTHPHRGGVTVGKAEVLLPCKLLLLVCDL